MCGIFGMLLRKETSIDPQQAATIIKSLFLLSESRGKEASGIAVSTEKKLLIYKEPVRAADFIKKEGYKEINRKIREMYQGGHWQSNIAVIGHSRLVTTGSQKLHHNNQPITTDWCAGVHNGIIVNTDTIWPRYPELTQTGQVDSELVFKLIQLFYREQGKLSHATSSAFSEIEGMASIATLFQNLNVLLLATNTGSLHEYCDPKIGIHIFASENFILKKLLHLLFKKDTLTGSIVQIRAGEGRIVHFSSLQTESFATGTQPEDSPTLPQSPAKRELSEIFPQNYKKHEKSKPPVHSFSRQVIAIEGRFEYLNQVMDRLRRCRRCILPETMPFITFDENGICNYCRTSEKIKTRGVEALDEIIAPHRKQGNHPDCIVGVSGGRDSCYSLHCLKNTLKMTPIAYTYDWGMVTDLARRNISRLCGKLGIEHILVSADIEKKRQHIKKNVLAWLKQPELGMVPLFMAGDKQFFFHAQQIKKQTGVDLVFLGENMLERTNFKTGFANVSPALKDKDHVYTLPLRSKIRLAGYYAGQFLTNISYINSSLIDTVFAFGCYYMIDRSYINLFRYIDWNEDEIIATLRNEYDWELARDTRSTWRIGDGTSAFYNFIYLTIAGFTENDTFRSNQVREGIITRDQALELIKVDNQPRFETIQWYLHTIGLHDSLKKLVNIVDAVPKKYRYE